MLTNDLNNLMKLYSMRGIEDWKKKTERRFLKEVGRHIPSSAVAVDEEDVRRMICRVFCNQDFKKQFIPMPKCSDPSVDWCFFLPVKINQGNNEYLRLFLLVKYKGYNWLGFRFEGDSQFSPKVLSNSGIFRVNCRWLYP